VIALKVRWREVSIKERTETSHKADKSEPERDTNQKGKKPKEMAVIQRKS